MKAILLVRVINWCYSLYKLVQAIFSLFGEYSFKNTLKAFDNFKNKQQNCMK